MQRQRRYLGRTPSEQKALGRRVEGFIQELWDDSLPGVLDAILWAKYKKPTRRDALMDTGTQGIVEASNDVVYGCGLASNGEVRSTARMVIVFLTSRMVHAFCLCMVTARRTCRESPTTAALLSCCMWWV